MNCQSGKYFGISNYFSMGMATLDKSINAYSRLGVTAVDMKYMTTYPEIKTDIAIGEDPDDKLTRIIKEKILSKEKQQVVEKEVVRDIKLEAAITKLQEKGLPLKEFAQAIKTKEQEPLSLDLFSSIEIVLKDYLGTMKKGLQKTLDVVNEEIYTLQKIKQINILPEFIGTVKSRQVPPRKLAMLREPRLRAELNAFQKDLADRIMSGDAQIPKVVKENITNQCRLILKAHCKQEVIVADCEVILALLADMPETLGFMSSEDQRMLDNMNKIYDIIDKELKEDEVTHALPRSKRYIT
jgi:DNA-binding transcriptional MerR regulator